MKHAFCMIALVITFLVSCTPARSAAPTVTAVLLPTHLPTIAPTKEPTPSVPSIEVGGIQVPDPKVTNPELFDIASKDSPVVQFANAFGLTPEEVGAGLKVEMETPDGMPAFAVMRTADGVVLMMATQNAEGEWDWEKATPGRYWFASGKRVGVFLDGDEFNYEGNAERLKEYFTDGVFALSGQVRPNAGRTPDQAGRPAREAKANHMALFFHYVVEPGKFPDDVNRENVDTWLNTRFEGIIKLLNENRTEGQPMYVVFNEAWEGNEWNQESNPLRDKYRSEWVEEYIYQLLKKFINEGLVPNEEFMVVFNDANLYDNPYKQDLMYGVLSTARTNAFSRLNSDSNTQVKLQEMGINSPEDIDILVGVQNHIKLGQNVDDGNFVPEPTEEEISNLADKFDSLGGIMMSEFNPNGTMEQQEQFLASVFSLLKDNPNLKGLLLWNIFDPDDSSDIFSVQKLHLFDDKGAPTKLYYALLGSK